MTSLVNISALADGSLNKALFAEGGINISQNAAVNENKKGGVDADLYTNGNFECDNSPVINGSIYAFGGSITMTGTCQALGDVWASQNVVLQGNKAIGRRVLAAHGSVRADGNTTINRTVWAGAGIYWSRALENCAALQCVQNKSDISDPPKQVFPILRGDAATQALWIAAGYQVVTRNSPAVTCASLGDWIAQNAPGFTVKTLLRTNCPVQFSSVDVKLPFDFALFADGGITSKNKVSFSSTIAGVARNVAMVVPYDAVTMHPCSTPVVSVDNQFSSSADLTLLWYSPCDISYANNNSTTGGSFGAIYSGGSISTNEKFGLNYRPVTIVGIDPSTQPVVSYRADPVWKREVSVS